MNQELINQGVIITSLGESLISTAAISGVSLKLQQFSIGDGGVDVFNPSYDDLKSLTSIPGEWDKRNLIDVYENPDGAGYIAEGLVPNDVGEGKFCRIAGYWTEDNQLFAMHLIPEWQKPVNSGNLLIELPLKAYFTVSDQANITLVIDPSLVQATREYVDRKDKETLDEVTNKFAVHYITSNSDAITNCNKLHLFTAFADLQIPDDTGTAFKFVVDYSVDLEAGQCRIFPPADQQINVSGVLSDICNIKDAGVIHTAIKVNNGWKV